MIHKEIALISECVVFHVHSWKSKPCSKQEGCFLLALITLLSSPINAGKQFAILNICMANTLPRSEVMEKQQKMLTLKYAQNKRQATEVCDIIHSLNEHQFRICRAFNGMCLKVIQGLEQSCRYPASLLLKMVKTMFPSCIIHLYLCELVSFIHSSSWDWSSVPLFFRCFFCGLAHPFFPPVVAHNFPIPWKAIFYRAVLSSPVWHSLTIPGIHFLNFSTLGFENYVKKPSSEQGLRLHCTTFAQLFNPFSKAFLVAKRNT